MDIRELTPWRKNRAISNNGNKNPFPRSLPTQFDRWFDDMGFGFDFPVMGTRLLANPDFSPQLDVVETAHAYRFCIDLPGMSEQDIDLSVEDGVLTLKGEKKASFQNSDTDKPVLLERHHGAFARAFTLPKDADEDCVDAVFERGVLTVIVKKTEIDDQRRKIKIKIKSPVKAGH